MSGEPVPPSEFAVDRHIFTTLVREQKYTNKTLEGRKMKGFR